MNETLYFKFKKMLFDAKKILLTDNGCQKKIEELDRIELKDLFVSITKIRDELMVMIYG